MYLLDTNVWVTHLRSKGLGRLSRRLLATAASDLATCSIVRAELMTGAMKSANPTQKAAEVRNALAGLRALAFDDPAADVYATLRADLERRGLMIGGNDLMIAAIARVHGLIVVTHDVSEFSRVPNLQIEDWQ